VQSVLFVLLNARKHAADRGERLARGWFDSFSSAPWFTGWSAPRPRDEPWMVQAQKRPNPVAAPKTWLASTGWMRSQCGSCARAKGHEGWDDPFACLYCGRGVRAASVAAKSSSMSSHRAS
jgi:hypothetical protein